MLLFVEQECWKAEFILSGMTATSILKKTAL
jgi:hypothetical protein